MKDQSLSDVENNAKIRARVAFKRYADALKTSRRVTTNPAVMQVSDGDDIRYLARGDEWIDNDNNRGVHIYGRGGVYIHSDR